MFFSFDKFDTTHGKVRSDSLVKSVDISRHRLFVIFPSDAVLLFTWFL